MIFPRILQQTINWLEQRRFVNLLLVIAYVGVIYNGHNPIANLSVWVMKGLSLPLYNKVVVVVSLFIAMLFVFLLFRQLRIHRDRLVVKVLYLLVVTLLISLHFKYLFEMNIEIIHVFEFAILSLLIFPLTRSFGATILLTVPFMLMDEWHQYVVLYPGYVEYFEFNDVVIDINGCGFMMLTLLICGIQNAKPPALWKRWDALVLAGSIILTAVLIFTGVIVFYKADAVNNTWLVLNHVPGAPTFWRQFPGRDVVYHIMQPLEALILIPVLLLFYFGLDYIPSKAEY